MNTYVLKILTSETNVTSKQINSIRFERFTVRLTEFAILPKLSYKTCVSSFLFNKYHLSIFYTCIIYEMLIIFTDFEKFDLSFNFVINFSFVNFSLTIYKNFSILR